MTEIHNPEKQWYWNDKPAYWEKVIHSHGIRLRYNPDLFKNQTIFMNKQPYFNTYTFVSRVLITHNMVNQYLLI